MSALTNAGRAVSGLGRLSRAQRVLTAVIAGAPVLAWVCALPAGAPFSSWTLTAVIILALLTAVGPDSHAGLTTVVFVGWYWFSHVSTRTGEPVSRWTLVAALLLMAFHAATAARATAPGPAHLDQAFWRRWLPRVAVIAAATGGVWGVTAVMASRHPGTEALTLAAFAALAGAAAYARWALLRDR